MIAALDDRITNCFKRFLPEQNKHLETFVNLLQLEDKTLRVTACGMLNAGKSSLLNALTDQLETEAFRTGPVRTTTKKAELSHHQFLFTDTPGLDVKAEDDKEAWATIRTADVLLFVHNPTNGELDQIEVDFLKTFIGEPGTSQQLVDRLLVVLTHLDSNDNHIEQVENSVRSQIKKSMGFDPQIFRVSYTTYCKGFLEKKTQLMEHSRIPILRNYLIGQLDRLQAAAIESRQIRIKKIKNELLMQLEQQISTREKTVAQLKLDAEKKNNHLRADFNQFFSRMQERLSAYNRDY